MNGSFKKNIQWMERSTMQWYCWSIFSRVIHLLKELEKWSMLRLNSKILSPSFNTWHSWHYYTCQCIILSLNILNNILEKIMKIWYFENTRDKSNGILYDIIYLYILVEKYGQSKIGQNYTFSNMSSIAGRREYKGFYKIYTLEATI